MQIVEKITTYVLIEDIAENSTAVLSHQVGGFLLKGKSQRLRYPQFIDTIMNFSGAALIFAIVRPH